MMDGLDRFRFGGSAKKVKPLDPIPPFMVSYF